MWSPSIAERISFAVLPLSAVDVTALSEASDEMALSAPHDVIESVVRTVSADVITQSTLRNISFLFLCQPFLTT